MASMQSFKKISKHNYFIQKIFRKDITAKRLFLKRTCKNVEENLPLRHK